MIAENMFKRTFYDYWKNKTPSNNFQQLELIINGKCDLKCSYCYFTRYRDRLFLEGSEDDEKIIDNLQVVKKWMEKNDFKDVPICLMSGEIFSQDIGFQVIETLINDFQQVKTIAIPTNMNFLLDEKQTSRVENLIKLSKEKNTHLHFSASLDGKFMEVNRPFRDPKKFRDDSFYDKFFRFSKEYDIGPHPMIYSNNIEKWKDNFLWFQENFYKYKLDPLKLYLLEVRNKEWTETQCKELGKFLNFLVKWTVDFFKYNNLDPIKSIVNFKPFNILMSPFMSTQRGFACSIQTALMLRLGNLTTIPCHRLGYKIFETSTLSPDSLEFEDKNISLGIAVYSTNGMPEICLACPINHLCLKGCLGSQHEEMGDLFIPIPTVCRLQHYKIISLLSAYKEAGILAGLMSHIPYNKQQQFLSLEKENLL